MKNPDLLEELGEIIKNVKSNKIDKLLQYKLWHTVVTVAIN